jgi:hypothetical protein
MHCCVSTVKMVTRTRHNFTLYVHFLSRLITHATVTFVETDSGVGYVRPCGIHTVRMTSLIFFLSFLISSTPTDVNRTRFTNLLCVFIMVFLMMDAIFFVEASGPYYPVTRHHIP